MAAEKPNLVHVEIYGQGYSLNAGADPGYVQKLAAHVDEKMREVGRSTAAVDSLKVAVLAALNIADEVFRARAGQDGTRDDAEKRVHAMVQELEAVLRD